MNMTRPQSNIGRKEIFFKQIELNNMTLRQWPLANRGQGQERRTFRKRSKRGGKRRREKRYEKIRMVYTNPTVNEANSASAKRRMYAEVGRIRRCVVVGTSHLTSFDIFRGAGHLQHSAKLGRVESRETSRPICDRASSSAERRERKQIRPPSPENRRFLKDAEKESTQNSTPNSRERERERRSDSRTHSATRRDHERDRSAIRG